MSKLVGTTAMVLPVGTPVEFCTLVLPRVGEEFKIIHVRTKKAVHRAKVTGFESKKSPQLLTVYEVRAVITK